MTSVAPISSSVSANVRPSSRRIPISVGARYAVNAHLSAGLAFSFPVLIAKNGTADGRTIMLGGSYAL